jgi:hypothetical protein
MAKRERHVMQHRSSGADTIAPLPRRLPTSRSRPRTPSRASFRVPFQNNFNFDAGSKEELQNVLNIQPVIPFRISDRWNLITRTIVPVIHQPELGAGIGNVSGLGDVQFSAFLSPAKPRGGVLWGVGPLLSLPTATDHALGAEKLGIGPTAVALAIHGPWLRRRNHRCARLDVNRRSRR